MMLKTEQKLGPQYRVQPTLPQPQRNPKLPQSKLFINNEWVDAASNKTLKCISPINGEVITKIARAEKGDVDAAVAAAKKAFELGSPWRTMDASRRGILLNRLAELMERDAVLLSSLETLECGKLYSATLKGDISIGIKYMRYYAGYADKHNGTVSSPDGPFIGYSRIEPVGVVGHLLPWNFSTQILCMKLAASLAAGCTMVVKPSQYSSLAALHIAELTKQAGFPPGVINIATGPGAVGAALVEHPDVNCISFTGSTPIGETVYQKASINMKKLVLALGGKSPNIILKDADIDEAVEHARFASFCNMGQCCCAGSRTYVHESIYEIFVQKMKERVSKMKIGDPFDTTVEHGPMATKEQTEVVMKYIEIAKKEGARLEIGGNRIEGPGYFIQPTIFADVKDNMTIAQEEVFGPVMQLSSYKTVEEVAERANNTTFGLASAVFGKDIDEINTLVQKIRAGNVWVNCYFKITPQLPFGGFKMSGIGREGGEDGIREFTQVKTVFMKTPTKNS